MAPAQLWKWGLSGLLKRAALWFTLLLEYPHVRKVFKQHELDGFFQYGSVPRKFNLLGQHVATEKLMSMRRLPRAGKFASELVFKGDGPVLPTYLPVEPAGSQTTLTGEGPAAAPLAPLTIAGEAGDAGASGSSGSPTSST